MPAYDPQVQTELISAPQAASMIPSSEMGQMSESLNDGNISLATETGPLVQEGVGAQVIISGYVSLVCLKVIHVKNFFRNKYKSQHSS